MEKTIKIISTIMLIIAICFSSTVVFASNPPAGQSGTGVSGTYIPKPNPDTGVATEISNVGGRIAGIVQVAGMSIAVIILIYIGIRYILGSAEDQANYKKSMIPYIVGSVILFLASFLVGVIYNFANSLNQAG